MRQIEYRAEFLDAVVVVVAVNQEEALDLIAKRGHEGEGFTLTRSGLDSFSDWEINYPDKKKSCRRL